MGIGYKRSKRRYKCPGLARNIRILYWLIEFEFGLNHYNSFFLKSYLDIWYGIYGGLCGDGLEDLDGKSHHHHPLLSPPPFA